jgi:cell division protein FtsN
MAQKKTKRRAQTRPRARKKADAEYPGWMWMIFGLAIGLSVAFAIYMKDQRAAQPTRPVAQQPASMATPMEQPSVASQSEPVAAEEETEPRFSFYSMLPNFEVVIPEQEADVKRDAVVEAVQKSGTYVLQAGSFAELADADRRRAELALLGIESRIQHVSIDERSFHRVRIGPTDDLDKLNRIRNQLRQADIDVLRIRLGD